jgi:hypothetical protein
MEARPSVFKRGFDLLWARPLAYAVVTLLPYVAALCLPILIGRIWFHAHPSPVDPTDLWRSLNWGQRLLVIAAMIASATVPTYVAARGACLLALEQQRNAEVSLGAVLADMLRFVPVALFYFLALGIATFLGSMCLAVPGLLIASGCALIIPAGIDGNLGPLAAMRRGFSLVGRVYGRVLGVYAVYLAFVLVGRVVLTVFMVVAGSDDEHAGIIFFILMGLWFLAFLLAMAPLNIMSTLLYCEARQMDAPPLAAAEAGG